MQHLQSILQEISNLEVEYPLWEDAAREAPSAKGKYTWIHLNERLLLGRPNWAALLSPPVSSFVAARAHKSRSQALLKFSALFWKLKLEET